jgi:gliding motility-associated-like protein
VDVRRKPVANAGSDVIICFNGTTLLTGSASNTSGPVTFSWSPALSVERADTSETVANPAASQVYTLTVRDNYACNFTVTDDVLVTKLPEPAPFAGNDTNAVYGIPHQLTGIGAGGGGAYAWELITPVNGSAVFSNRSSANPTVVFQPMGVPQGTTYDSNYYRVALTTTDAAGCSGYDTVTIHIYNGPTYYVPNAFSPNNDGVNDVFRPVPVGVANTEYFRIFNRYGQVVYETNRFRQGWDGTFKGQPQPLGAYVWLLKGIDRNGRKIELKGTVMLVR